MHRGAAGHPRRRGRARNSEPVPAADRTADRRAHVVRGARAEREVRAEHLQGDPVRPDRAPRGHQVKQSRRLVRAPQAPGHRQGERGRRPLYAIETITWAAKTGLGDRAAVSSGTSSCAGQNPVQPGSSASRSTSTTAEGLRRSASGRSAARSPSWWLDRPLERRVPGILPDDGRRPTGGLRGTPHSSRRSARYGARFRPYIVCAAGRPPTPSAMPSSSRPPRVPPSSRSTR